MTTVRDFVRHLAGVGGFVMREHLGHSDWLIVGAASTNSIFATAATRQ